MELKTAHTCPTDSANVLGKTLLPRSELQREPIPISAIILLLLSLKKTIGSRNITKKFFELLAVDLFTSELHVSDYVSAETSKHVNKDFML